ncbi:MNIO family bufferin maturase [Pelagibius marinus]|uniref:MNIO family bufferin maturase n=1 Tax=Pelagibius marinus TaxID=2762760 RepID=UPI0018728DBD|nr:DUF692 domain-containing protein [Pelagibius marinus]
MSPPTSSALRRDRQPPQAVPGVGIALKHQHYRDWCDTPPPVGWLEVHSENYFGGGRPLAVLESLRADYPVSLHGVGLSLGSAGPLNRDHLQRLKALQCRIEPAMMSEHLSWSSAPGAFLADLLPLPYTPEALALFCTHVEETQDFLGRQILVENPSSYLAFDHSTIPEWEFLAAVVERTGCGLLLDVNNVYVSACNHGFDPLRYLNALPAEAVGEIHLAGHSVRLVGGRELRIDDHGSAVCDDVWALYVETMARLGPRPTLIEWDSAVPPLQGLLGEAEKAQHILGTQREAARADAG